MDRAGANFSRGQRVGRETRGRKHCIPPRRQLLPRAVRVNDGGRSGPESAGAMEVKPGREKNNRKRGQTSPLPVLSFSTRTRSVSRSQALLGNEGRGGQIPP